MKYSNYRELKKTKENTFANVDVTSGWLFRSTETTTVFKPQYSSFWRDIKTGNFCEGTAVEHLANAYEALKDYRGNA